MTLEEYINSLAKGKQFVIAIRLARLTLPIWEKYADKNQLNYRDSVVGLQHSVEKDLLKNTIDAMEKYISTNLIYRTIIRNTQLSSLSKQFRDPIVAMQDLDWELPYEVERAFYAVHNILEAALGKEITFFNETTIYVSINQSIDLLVSSKTLTENEIRKVLYENK